MKLKLSVLSALSAINLPVQSPLNNSLPNTWNQYLRCHRTISSITKEQLNSAWANKSSENEASAKRVRTNDLSVTTENRPASIAASLSAQGRPLANAAILEFLVVKGISVHIVNSPEFRKMISAIRDAGPYYLPPNSHAFGKDSARSDNELGLGEVLFSEFTRLKLVKETLISGVSSIGGTLCSDGAKWRKRNCLNSVLQTSIGSFFCQSTGN